MVPEVVVKLVEELKETYTISLLLETLDVARATYYRWKKKYLNQTEDPIVKRIGELCKAEGYKYGYRKIHHELNKELDGPINLKRVQRIMQKNGWNCRVRPKKRMRLGKPYYLTENRLNRQFQADQPMTTLVTDITYLPFGSSMLYLSSIMDLYNGEIVAFTIGDKQDTAFVIDTLNQLELSEGVMLHSDQGSVYTSKDYYLLSKEKGIIRSMSRKGTPADNAPIESFHSSLKCEAFYINTEQIRSNDIVIDIVKHYIKNYNQHRIQQKLGYLSPVEYRLQAA